MSAFAKKALAAGWGRERTARRMSHGDSHRRPPNRDGTLRLADLSCVLLLQREDGIARMLSAPSERAMFSIPRITVNAFALLAVGIVRKLSIWSCITSPLR